MPDGSPPAYLWVPPYVRTDGDLAERAGQWVGLDEDRNQRAVLDAVFAEDENHLPACFEVGLVAARQNLKTATLHEIAVTWLFGMGLELIIWTAHQADTAEKAHEWLKQRIDRNPDLKAQCKWPPPSSNQDRAIELKSGERIEFHTRTGGRARGLTGDKVIFDEALFLEPAEVGAVLPTMATRPDAQVVYASSAGLLRSAVLRSVRDRGRAGGDPSLAYFEWSAPRVDCGNEACVHEVGYPGCALDRRDLWAAANPALGAGRISVSALAKFRKAMAPGEFAREFLGWWDDPPNLDAAFDADAWALLADADAERGSRPTFAVAVAPDRSWAAIAVAWERTDGDEQVMVADYRPTTTWVADRATELVQRWGGTVVAADDAADLVPDAVRVSGADVRRAEQTFDDALTARSIRHGNQPALNVSVRAARWRKKGDGRALDRSGSVEISPLVAVTLALHAVRTQVRGGWMVGI